jgi:putative addiction module component (TIGR02574 family)
MDMKAIVAEVSTWPAEDRAHLMNVIRDGLPDMTSVSDLTNEQIAELERRLAEDDASPDDYHLWDDVKADILRRHGL